MIPTRQYKRLFHGSLLKIICLFLALGAASVPAVAAEKVFISRAHPYAVTQFDEITQVEEATHSTNSSCPLRKLDQLDGEPFLYGVDDCGRVIEQNTVNGNARVVTTGVIDSSSGRSGDLVLHPDTQRLIASRADQSIIEIDIASGNQTSHNVGAYVFVFGVSANGQLVYYIDFDYGATQVKSFNLSTQQVTPIATVPNRPMPVAALDPRGRFILFGSQETPSSQPTNEYYDVYLHRVDLQSFSVDQVTIMQGFEPKDIEMNNAGTRAYVLVAWGVQSVSLGASMTLGADQGRSTLGAIDVGDSGLVWGVDDVFPYEILVWDSVAQQDNTFNVSTNPGANLYDLTIAHRPDCYDPFDTDHDGVGNLCDNCPNKPNPDQKDVDGDGAGDVCDGDIDGDGVLNNADNCPYHANPNQSDLDGDGVGDVCEIFDYKALMRALDVRLEAAAVWFRDHGIDGPWGPWGPFTRCVFEGCESIAGYETQYELGRQYAAAYAKKYLKGDSMSAKDMVAMFLLDETLDRKTVDAFFDKRVQK